MLRRLEVISSMRFRRMRLQLQPLSVLHALEHLVLTGTTVSNLGPLTSCSQLQFLDLNTCQSLKDLAPLAHCSLLLSLDLVSCPVEDLGPLACCKQLQYLDLGYCPIEDLGPLAQCTELRTLKLAGIGKLPSLRQPDLGPLGACVLLQRLDLNNCGTITNLKPLRLCTNLLHLDLFCIDGF